MQGATEAVWSWSLGNQRLIGQEELGITNTLRDGGLDAGPQMVAQGPPLWDPLGLAIPLSL